MKLLLCALLGTLIFTGCLSDNTIIQNESSENNSVINPTKNSPAITPGTYQHEEVFQLTLKDDGIDAKGIMLGELSINEDGTYLLQVFQTSEDLSLNNSAYGDMKGNYSISGENLTFSHTLERFFDPKTEKMTSWTTPYGGDTDTGLIRNVTSNSFQEFNKGEQKWVTWVRK